VSSAVLARAVHHSSGVHLNRLARYLILPAFLLVTAVSSARAQTHVSDTLTFLVTNRTVDTGSAAADTAAAAATSRTISHALLASLSTLPVTSTSGAFSYRLNPDIGTVQRTTQTFGPALVDRALTSGAGTIGVGLAVQHLRFTSLDGRNLRNGSLVTTANQFVDESEPFDVDALTLRLDADVMTAYANVGLGSRFDVAAAAPLVWLRMDGSRVNTYRGRQVTQARARADAVGFADLLLRAKATVFDEDGMSLATAVDVRLPTGREADLLGTGKTSVRLSGIGSLEGARTSAHASVGAAFGGLATDVTIGAAVTTAVTPHVTVGAEALGRWMDLPGSIVSVSQPHPTLAGVNTTRLLPGDARLTSLTLAPSVKWNLTDTWVLVAHVGVPMFKGGLRAPILPLVGLEYSLGR